MLSSTAKNLYWMGRYLQRAKSTARLIEATQRMALQSRGEEAAGVAAIFGMEDEFRQTQQQIERPGCRQPDRLPGDRREQPLLDRELDRRGAAQRPRGAQQHHGRRLGEPERPVARAQRPPARQPRRARPRRADRIGEEAGGDDLRRRAGHPAARRGLQLPAARRLPRARRQHRPHPRREVPPAAARRRSARRRRSTTSPGPRCWPASARCAPTGASIAARSIP